MKFSSNALQVNLLRLTVRFPILRHNFNIMPVTLFCEKARGSIITDGIRMKCQRYSPSKSRLIESDFRYDVIVSRRRLWHRFMQKTAATWWVNRTWSVWPLPVPDWQYIHTCLDQRMTTFTCAQNIRHFVLSHYSQYFSSHQQFRPMISRLARYNLVQF